MTVPPTTEEAFGLYTMNDGTSDPCPWCQAPWTPSPETGYGAAERIHTDECPYWTWLCTDDEFGHAEYDEGEAESRVPHADTCPEHGDQLVTGYGSTGGPDPYAINKLACGHGVACFGPGEANVIVSTKVTW